MDELKFSKWYYKPANMYIGNGILEQVKPTPVQRFTVETLYELTDCECWPLLDVLLKDRTDLHYRIQRFKLLKTNNNG